MLVGLADIMFQNLHVFHMPWAMGLQHVTSYKHLAVYFPCSTFSFSLLFM
jgi:hypothetical protein